MQAAQPKLLGQWLGRLTADRVRLSIRHDPDQSGEWSKSGAILPPAIAAFNAIAGGLS